MFLNAVSLEFCRSSLNAYDAVLSSEPSLRHIKCAFNTSETFREEMYTYESFANKCIQKLKYEFADFFKKNKNAPNCSRWTQDL